MLKDRDYDDSFDEDEEGEHILTPQEQGWAKEAQEIMAHPAYADGSHPLHLRAVRQARELLTAAYGTGHEAQEELERPISSQERILTRGF